MRPPAKSLPPESPPELTNGGILVLDTDSDLRESLERTLKCGGRMVYSAATVEEAISILQRENILVVILEMLPVAELTLDVLTTVVNAPTAPKVLCVSVDASPKLVTACMKRGAESFIQKPYSLTELQDELTKMFLSSELNTHLADPLPGDPDAIPSLLVGASHPVRELRLAIRRLARTNINCLIRGASGTGKDLVAREIHRLSVRRTRPFVKVNCSALPEHLLESELFGYERGAFTGAVSAKPGRFSLANNGTIFLDEIAEMYTNLQAKLLEVIEHKQFTKLGGREATRVDVQIISATNADMESRTKEGTFRSDLYFRLNEACLWVPQLQERKEDIPVLARHFITKYRHFRNGSQPELGQADLAALQDYSWPGNVRELESLVKRWLVFANGNIRDLLSQQPGTLSRPRAQGTPPPEDLDRVPPVALTRDLLLATLEQHQWNRRKTAETLGLSYQTLRRHIAKHGLV